jgi:soluble lytic murein transglycosylase
MVASSFGAIDFTSLQDYPRSLAKDFYIYRFLSEQKPSSKEAWQLLTQVQGLSPTLLKELNKHINEPGFNHAIGCLYLDSSKFWEVDSTCKAIRVSPSLFVTLSTKQRKELYENLSASYPNLFNWMEVLLEDEPFKKLLESEHFLYIYTQAGQNFRQEKLNYKIPIQRLQDFSKSGLFELFVTKVVYEKGHQNVAKSLLLLNPQESNPNSKASFLLALNALMNQNLELATVWFKESASSAYLQSEKDKANFWIYLISKDLKDLQIVAQSWDYNMYSVAAREKLALEPFELSTPKATIKKRKHYSVTDPFTWRETLEFISGRTPEALEVISQDFLTQETLPQYAFIKERATKYKEPLFIIPFSEHLTGMSDERKALILAIARQESRFIPASISTSYALGIMQFMPFLAKDIARKEGVQNFDLNQMFQPRIAYKFADIHLDYLTSWLYHPVLVAYAYNGGIGFTKRILQQEHLFEAREFDPFLSMELIPYAESREYAKKVLANYVAYKQILGQSVSIWDLFEKLNQPNGVDRFRSSK